MNRIKIIYNSTNTKAYYQFMNDNGKWGDVPKESELSRLFYANAIAEDRIKELLQVIDKRYNGHNEGVNILYCGKLTVYDKFLVALSNDFVDRNIKCIRYDSKNIVVGKRNAGKTCLIEGIMAHFGKDIVPCEIDRYIEYEDDGVSLYEIKGIEPGLENVQKAFETVEERIMAGTRTVLYCFSFRAGKFEEIEIKFIKDIESRYADVQVIPIITGCIDEQRAIDFSQKISSELGGREVILTLAKEMNTKVGTLASFGLDKVIGKLSGGE